MSAYFNALREEATREELLHEVERQWEKANRYRGALQHLVNLTEDAPTGPYHNWFPRDVVEMIAKGALNDDGPVA